MIFIFHLHQRQVNRTLFLFSFGVFLVFFDVCRALKGIYVIVVFAMDGRCDKSLFLFSFPWFYEGLFFFLVIFFLACIICAVRDRMNLFPCFRG